MFKSIFSKYFAIVSLVIVISFVAMGAMQSFLSIRYWLDEKETLLTENAKAIADITAQNWLMTSTESKFSVDETMLRVIVALSNSMDADVLITDGEGSILASAAPTKVSMARNVPSSVIQKLRENQSYFSLGTLDGLYQTRQYAAGTPIVKMGVPVGYVFTVVPADSLTEHLLENLRMFVLSAIGVLILAFIAVYVMTYRMVKPLREMAAATRSFGTGDFSHRITVKGRDEMAELATSLNNMAISLASVEGMSRSFIANISHELKTPMTTITGFIDGILDGTIPEEKRDYYLKIVSDEVKRLSRLVKAMLDLSRIDNGSLRIHPVQFDLTQMACTSLLSFEPRIEEKHITVMGLEDCPPMGVTADRDLIGQVVYNLLDNAVKFTNEGGTIAITITHRDNRTYFAVRNSGIGIASAEMPYIFDRFYKSDKSRSLDKNGVGLGLFIVKSVINLHHGEIYVRSVEGEYCEFFFWLPDVKSPAA